MAEFERKTSASKGPRKYGWTSVRAPNATITGHDARAVGANLGGDDRDAAGGPPPAQQRVRVSFGGKPAFPIRLTNIDLSISSRRYATREHGGTPRKPVRRRNRCWQRRQDAGEDDHAEPVVPPSLARVDPPTRQQ